MCQKINIECGLIGAICYLIKCHLGTKFEPAGKGHFPIINSDIYIFFSFIIKKEGFDCSS